jgi:transposase
VGKLPEGVTRSAFGPKLSSIIALLTGKYHISKRESKSLVEEFFGVKISLGSIIAIEKRMSTALKPLHEKIHAAVTQQEEVTHVDETGWRDSGKNCYTWVVSTETFACFFLRSRRNRDTCYEILGKDFSSPLVTDRNSVYHCFTKKHQWCLAHITRDFQRFAECKGLDGIIGKGLKKDLESLFTRWHLYKEGEISFQKAKSRCGYYRGKIKEWLQEGLRFGKEKLANFCDALLRRFDWLWTFLRYPGMDPTNNRAERDIRGIVLWRKRSFGTRSESGKRFVERISSVVLTAYKQSKPALNVLYKAYMNSLVSELS